MYRLGAVNVHVWMETQNKPCVRRDNAHNFKFHG